MNQPGIIFGDSFDTEERWQVPQPEDLPYLTGVKRISLDTENSGLNPFTDTVCGIAISWRDPDTHQRSDLYVPVGHSEGNMDPEVVKSWLAYVLPGKEVVFVNGKYDIQIMRTFGIDLEALGVIPRDATFPDALLDDNRRAGRKLEDLSQRYLGRGKVQTDLNMDCIKDYPSWMVAPYGMGDSGNTLEIDEVCDPLIRQQGLDKVLDLENSIIYPVCEIERNGCRLDVEKLERWRKEVRDEYEQVIMELNHKTGMMINPDGPDDMARLFRRLGVNPPNREGKKKKGQSKKDREEAEAKAKARGGKKTQLKYEVEELVAMRNPVIDLVVQARQLSSLLSKFLDKYHDGLVDDPEIIRAQFHQLKGDEGGTVRGRFSSSGGKDLRSGWGFNAQQVIKTKQQQETTGDRWIVRELFIPDPGFRYVSVDASQIEYRLAAHFAGAEKILKAYRDNPKTDFHAMIQGHIQQYKPTFDNRTITKNTNFAYVFGAGAEQLAITCGISIREAEELLAICKKIFPEAPVLLARLAEEAKNRGYVSTIFGRRARFGPKDRHYAALNACIQGSAADVFKVSLRAVYDERKTLGIHKLRQIVHDEFDADVYPDEAYHKRMLEFFNEQRVSLNVPIIWNMEIGNNWKDCH